MDSAQTPRTAPHRDPAVVRRLRRIGLAAAAMAGLLAAVVLASWIAGAGVLRGLEGDEQAAPLTAALLAAASLALLLQRVRGRAVRHLAVVLAAAVMLISGARLLELAGATGLGVDRLAGRLHPSLDPEDARTPAVAAAALLVAGGAILLLHARRRAAWRAAAQGLALALAPLPLIAVVTHAYRVTLFPGIAPGSALALPAAAALLLLVVAILLARPEDGFVANLASAGTGSAMARRVLAYAAALPLVLGWLALAGSQAGAAGAVAVSAVVVALTLVLALLVLRDAAALDRMELAKERAQAERETSRQELALALRREQDARAHAEAASRAKDEFLTTLSHELRTPLNAILGWSRLLRDTASDPERLRRGLGVIERNGRALAQLVSDLLDVSRLARGAVELERTEVDLVAVIEGAVEALRGAAEAKGVPVHRAVGEDVPRVLGDPARLQQVVWNLLTNAIKFTPQGGRVEVRLGTEAGRAVVTVEDTGAGIPPEFLPDLFQRFRQADGSPARHHGGLGLGLALTRELVALHGGTVEASSAGPGRGATFRVSLPAAPRAAGTPAPSPGWPAREWLGGARILVVDDEADSRELLLQLLASWGARPVGAASAREALLCASLARPDLVVSDIAMPGEDGFALVRRLRARERERGATPVPVLALTAFARPEDRRRVLEAGFQAHVAKPIEPGALCSALASLLQAEPGLAAVEVDVDGEDAAQAAAAPGGPGGPAAGAHPSSPHAAGPGGEAPLGAG